MKNELIVNQSQDSKPVVKQDGQHNIYVENHATVNLNVSNSRLGNMSIAGLLRKLKSLDNEYYNLLVTLEDLSQQDYITVSTERALTKDTVPEEIYENCSNLSDEAMERLMTYPAIICNENTDYYGKTNPEQKAIYAVITKIKKHGKQIRVYFQPIDTFEQQKLIDYAFDFDLDMDCAITDLNRSWWLVKKVNLAEVFIDVGIEMGNC